MNPWKSILAAPSFVINLDRCKWRLSATLSRVQNAGFTNVKRFSAIDASNPKLLEEKWDALGKPLKNSIFDPEFLTFLGKQGVCLSQIFLWKKIVDEQIPISTIFEDDVMFHPQWAELAPLYWGQTPPSWDVLFIGSQHEFNSTFHVDKGPVFCLHAYIITLEGAKRLLNNVLSRPGGLYTIDTMLKVEMDLNTKSFQWYVWNGKLFPCSEAEMPNGWSKRNNGLVFQDESFGTDVRPW